MGNTDFIRYEAAEQIAEAIGGYVDATVTVDVVDPGGANLRNEHIFCDSISGSTEYTSVAGGLMPHDDRFTVNLVVYVFRTGRSATPATAAKRCQELMSAVNRAVSLDPTIGQLDGVIDATVGTVNGPVLLEHEDGWVAYSEIEIAVHTRLTNS